MCAYVYISLCRYVRMCVCLDGCLKRPPQVFASCLYLYLCGPIKAPDPTIAEQ